MKIYNNLTELIGHTPLVRASGISEFLGAKCDIIAKLESFNPLSSAKDRIALSMIDDAEAKGILKPGSTVIEPTSGNTGIGLAFVAAIRGYKLILTMPDTMSIERRKLVSHLGAQIVLTPGVAGMQGAIDESKKLAETIPDSFIPAQFDNPTNSLAHEKTTAEEIWHDTDGKVDIFVAGVGSGGTVTGTARGLKAKNPDIKVVAVEPLESAVISGEKPGVHNIQGIGAGFIPSIFDKSVIDEVLPVSTQKSIETARMAAKTDGLLVGISSGAALYAAAELSKRPENAKKCIIALLPDTGERYLSTDLFL